MFFGSSLGPKLILTAPFLLNLFVAGITVRISYKRLFAAYYAHNSAASRRIWHSLQCLSYMQHTNYTCIMHMGDYCFEHVITFMFYFLHFLIMAVPTRELMFTKRFCGGACQKEELSGQRRDFRIWKSHCFKFGSERFSVWREHVTDGRTDMAGP